VTHLRYTRQLIAPGFRQAALERRLVCLSPGRLDPALHHLALVAGAMGVTRQTLALPAPRCAPLAGPARLLRLNPSVALEIVSLDLGLALCAPEDPEGPYVVADVTDAPRTFAASMRRLGKRAPERVRFFARGRDSIVIGRSLREVRAQAGRPPVASLASTAPLGLHGVEAAGHLLGDYLAAARAYDDPALDEPMPRAPELLEIRPATAIARPPAPLTALLVGGGGALAHAFWKRCCSNRRSRVPSAGWWWWIRTRSSSEPLPADPVRRRGARRAEGRRPARALRSGARPTPGRPRPRSSPSPAGSLPSISSASARTWWASSRMRSNPARQPSRT
jgi:hypothetical protein